MKEPEHHTIIGQFYEFAGNRDFPCAGARSAINRNQLQMTVAGHMACPHDDASILAFLYDFIDGYRLSGKLFQSAGIIFQGPLTATGLVYETLLWQRLQSLADADDKNYGYDKRVSADPRSPGFSFSLKEEAFFIIFLHPASERKARTFAHPVIIFNPHDQFEKLKRTGQFERFKNVTRHRDQLYSGSVNPMLDDYGYSSEARQYSGNPHSETWQCPLKKRNG